MMKYIFQRMLYLIPIMIGVSFLTFLLLYIAPSDPVTMQYESMGVSGDASVMEEKREKLGLNDPFYIQYFHWLGKVVKGNFGDSVKYGHSVREELAKRLPKTVLLSGTALLLTILFSIPLGMLSAVYQNRIADHIIRFLSFVGVSMPSFWMGLLLIYWLSIRLKLLPIMGSNGFKSLIMPSITLSVWLTATYVRRVRASILEEIHKDYVVGLRSRGVSMAKILWQHILPNSLLTIVTMFGMSIGAMLGGTTVVETIFEWQGIGKMAADAVTGRDYQLMQGYVLWMAFIYVAVNLLVDILYRYLDPRIRRGGAF